MDRLRNLPDKTKGELPVIPVDERAAEVRAKRSKPANGKRPPWIGSSRRLFRKTGRTASSAAKSQTGSGRREGEVSKKGLGFEQEATEITETNLIKLCFLCYLL
jgi:hypothetical protein